jgi:hypothetical protein
MEARGVKGGGGAEVWRRVFEEHAAGLGSAAALCARHGVSKGSWYYWKRRLAFFDSRNSPPTPAGAARFAELVVREEMAHVQEACGGVIEVILPGGAVVRVLAGAGERELEIVLRVLRSC